jgi:hypothetical protein
MKVDGYDIIVAGLLAMFLFSLVMTFITAGETCNY